MEETEFDTSVATPPNEKGIQNRQALLLLCLCAAVILLSLFLTIGKADPRGVYISAYEITADGERESTRSYELHLKSNGIATYVKGVNVGSDTNLDIEDDGRWEWKNGKICLTFGGETTILHRSGNKLIEKLEDGRRIVLIKE